METLTISFDKEILFNRCHTDVAVRGQHIDPPMQMCEHDRSWFEVALTEACNIALEELSRIAKEVVIPMTNTETIISFSVHPTCARQESLLPYVIERALIDHIVNMWYAEHIAGAVVDSSKSLLNLKHATLINNGTHRKPNF